MKSALLYFLILAFSLPPKEATTVAQAPAVAKEEYKPPVVLVAQKPESQRLLEKAKQYTYVRETSSSNRGKEIDSWNKLTGAPMGSPYCASFVSWVHKEVGVKAPISAWSPDSVSRNNIPFSQIKGGDVFGMYFSSKGRVAHTGFVEKVSGSLVYTVEANTGGDSSYGSAADRDGSGVYAKFRSKSLMANSKNKYSRYWK